MVLKNYCRFEFSNQFGVFYSGAVMNGTFHMNLNRPKKITELELLITGGAKCMWTETYYTGKSTVTVYYSGKETYFNITNSLLAGKSYPITDGCVELPAGEHKFDFSAFIPPEASTSFEGVYGRVRYTAKVTFKRPGLLDSNQSLKASFTVLRNHNLNLHPYLKDSTEVNDSKDFHMFFFKSGSLHITANLPHSGFVPGQTIPIQCIIENKSSISIVDTKFTLKQNAIYKVKSPTKKQRCHRKTLSEFKSNGVEKKQSENYNVSLYIPAVPPSTDTLTTTILEISYFIQIKAFVMGMHKNYKLKIPVEIGTIPFVKYDELPNNPSTSQSAGAPNYADYAPPSYEEVLVEDRMKENKSDEKGDNEDADESEMYNPKYPVFHFPEKNPL